MLFPHGSVPEQFSFNEKKTVTNAKSVLGFLVGPLSEEDASNFAAKKSNCILF